MSIPEKSAVATSSTVISSPFHSSVVPAERAEEKKRIDFTGEAAFLEQRAHDAADLSGGADDCDIESGHDVLLFVIRFPPKASLFFSESITSSSKDISRLSRASPVHRATKVMISTGESDDLDR